ncbi:MAG: hypothetical protein HUJ54_10535 [Erysipelotrichaceae bacterium]|nr:hypothetical protein [Erysipelotrichaceae bacterium]
MSRIYVDFAQLEDVSDQCRLISSRIDKLQKELNEINRSLNWKVKSREVVSNNFRSISASLESVSGDMKKYSEFTREALDQYRKLNGMEPPKSSINIETSSDQRKRTIQEIIHLLLHLPEYIADILNRIGKNTDAGLFGDFFAFMLELLKYFRGWDNTDIGLASFFGVGAAAFGAWTGMYDYILKALLKNNPKLLDGVGTGLFSAAGQKGVLGVNIVGSLFESAQKFSKLYSEPQTRDFLQWTAAYIDAAQPILDIGKDVYELKDLSNAKSVFSGGDFYLAAANGGIEAVQQGFESYSKYQSDGVTLQEWAYIGVESSVEGIGGIIHTLTFGLDEPVMAVLDILMDGKIDKPDNMSYYDLIAQELENWTVDVGNGVGALIYGPR